MTTADEAKNEVQENVVSNRNSKILTCVALLGWLNMLREYEQGNMTMGNMSREIYIALFCYCYQLLFQPRSPTFKTVNNRRAISVRMRAAVERQLQQHGRIKSDGGKSKTRAK